MSFIRKTLNLYKTLLAVEPFNDQVNYLDAQGNDPAASVQ